MELDYDTTAASRLISPLTSSLDEAALESLVSFRADEQAQQRIELLAEKCNDGTLSAAEAREYESLVQTSTVLAILQAEAKKRLPAEKP